MLFSYDLYLNCFCHQHAEPTGLVIDAAMKLISSYIPETSADKRREGLLVASNVALMNGVTTVVDVGRYSPGESIEHSWEDLSGFCELIISNLTEFFCLYSGLSLNVATGG